MKTITALSLISTGILHAQEAPPPVKSFWISGDVLLWKAHEDRLSYTNEPSPRDTTTDFTMTKLVSPHYEWNVGSRIAFGAPIGKWDVTGSWTRINNNAKGKRHLLPQDGMFPVWSLSEGLIVGDYVFDASLRWEAALNVIDFGGVRTFDFYDRFSLKTRIEARSAWINQDFLIHYNHGIFLSENDRVKMRNDFWGMGPLLGLDPIVKLGKGFSLIGGAAVSALYGYFSIKQQEVYLGAEQFERHAHPTKLRWVLDFDAALDWKTALYGQTYNLSFRIGWEWHRFYSQNLLQQNQYHLLGHSKNLTYHGWFFSGAFEF